MSTYHVIGQARFKNSQCDNVNLFVHAPDALAAVDKVKKHLDRDGELAGLDLQSLNRVGEALEEAR